MTKRMKSNTDPLPRRGFLSLLWKVLTGVAILEMIFLAAAFFRSRGSRQEKSTETDMVDAGPVSAYAAGSVTAFVQGRFYLCRLEDGGFLAVSRQCTHLGCTVPWNETEKKFICPCHASTFDIRGDRLTSPASRPLDLHPVSIVNGMIRVDAGARIRRSEFRPEQVVFPKEGTP